MPNEVKLNKDSQKILTTHKEMMKLHYMAMGCHCEVMGMMSENMLCAVTGQPPMFDMLHFRECLRRWGLANEKGEPII